MSAADLAAALTTAGAPFVGERNASELAANLTYALLYDDGAADDAIASALACRSVQRAGGAWTLAADVDRPALEGALLEAFLDSPRVCSALGCYGWCECAECADDEDDCDATGWDPCDDDAFDYADEGCL